MDARPGPGAPAAIVRAAAGPAGGAPGAPWAPSRSRSSTSPAAGRWRARRRTGWICPKVGALASSPEGACLALPLKEACLPACLFWQQRSAPSRALSEGSGGSPGSTTTDVLNKMLSNHPGLSEVTGAPGASFIAGWDRTVAAFVALAVIHAA